MLYLGVIMKGMCTTPVYPRLKGNGRVYIERMLMSARYNSIAHAYESIFEIYLQFVLIL